MLVRKKHLLLRLLKVRVIVDSKEIYDIPEAIPVIVPCKTPVTTFIISNGFHFSRLIEVTKVPGSSFFYQVDCLVDDIHLFYLVFLSLLFFVLFIFTEMRFFMILANLPILYILYVLYFLRKNFIVITAMGLKKVDQYRHN